MANALGDRSSTKILTAEQLGTPSNHIAIAYIDSIQPAPPFNEDLQATCNIGNTTTTPIICDSLTATANDITAAAGDIEATLGDITAGGEIYQFLVILKRWRVILQHLLEILKQRREILRRWRVIFKQRREILRQLLVIL
jgi:hypothetical protein